RVPHGRARRGRPRHARDDPVGAQRCCQLPGGDRAAVPPGVGGGGLRRRGEVPVWPTGAGALRLHRRVKPRRSPTTVAIAALAAIGALLVVLPLVGLLIRAPWSDAAHQLRSHEVRVALRLSVFTSLCATACAL